MCLGLAFLTRHGKAVPLQTEILLEKPPLRLARKSGLSCINPSEMSMGAHSGQWREFLHSLLKANISPCGLLKVAHFPFRTLAAEAIGHPEHWVQFRCRVSGFSKCISPEFAKAKVVSKLTKLLIVRGRWNSLLCVQRLSLATPPSDVFLTEIEQMESTKPNTLLHVHQGRERIPFPLFCLLPFC